MKKILLSLVIISTFAACNNNDKTDTTQRNIQLLRDSAVYKNSNIYSDTMAHGAIVGPVTEKPVTQKITPKAPQKKTVRVSAKSGKKAPVYVKTNEQRTETNSGSGQNAGVGGSNGTTSSQTQKKKGWSKATTGAVIGGAAGAAGGAIISKKKGVGAAVGAVVGAASGYIIGKDMDKKDKKN